MKLKYVRISLVLWACINLVLVGYSALKYPLVKMSVPGAISTLESKYILDSKKTEIELESYYFLKNQILGVSNGYKKSAETRQNIVIFIGVGNALLTMLLFFVLPLLTNRSMHSS